LGDTFGTVLRRYRLGSSLTQEALAERAALSATAVAALERGRSRAPRLSTLRQLARALDLNPEELADLARLSRAVEVSDTSGGHHATDDGDPADGGRFDAGSNGEVVPILEVAGDLDLLDRRWGRVAAPAISRRDGAPAGGTPTIAALPGPAIRPWRTDFVGRGSELQQLRTAWAQRGRLVEVLGEPGVGKTRLVGQLAHEVHAGGGTVLWGRCSEERLGAYLPFVEILRQLTASADTARLAAVIDGRGELTRLVPELAQRLGGLAAPTRAEAGTEQRLLFDSVAALLARWCPVLVVIDDLHWSDDATLGLLSYLVKDDRLDGVTIVGTARGGELEPAQAGRLAELGRHTPIVRVRLDGFGADDLGAMLCDLVGSPVSPAMVGSVAAATEGNPFFSEEMVVHLVDAGLVRESDDGLVLRAEPQTAGVPERIRETLVRRLLSLPQDSVELLSVGALIGREFDLSTAASATGLAGARLVDAADEGLLSGLVMESAAGRLSFSHALVQQTLSGRLSQIRAAEIHRRVAQELQARFGDAPDVAAELARHWSAVAAVDPSASASAASWAVRAGDVALAAAASDEAIARYEEAAAQWSSGTLGHADALVRLGEALQHRGRADEADQRFRQAHHLALALGDVQVQARAAIGLGRRYPYWETDSDRIALLEGALASLPPDGNVFRLTVMGLLVTHLVNGFHPDEAGRRDELADELGAVASGASNPDVLLSIGHTRIFDCIEDPDDLQDVAGRLVEVGESHNDLRVLAGAHFAHGLAALDAGDMDRLHAAADRYAEVAARLDDPRELSQAAMVRSTIATITGRYAEAEVLSSEALAHGSASGDFNAELVHYGQGLLRAIDLGLAADVLPLLTEASDYQRIAVIQAGIAITAAIAGEHDLARATLDRLVESGFESKPRGADRLASTAFLAHACVAEGAIQHAEALSSALSASLATVVRVGPLIGWWGPIDHHIGTLQRLLGHDAAAEHHLRRAIGVERAMGALPFAARTGAELAATLVGRDPSGATLIAEEALAAARSLGAQGIVTEVGLRIDTLG
jgi:transcriptional regulator with XRE-family HTH domain/tetratricopeptide (TPR) repeat protein